MDALALVARKKGKRKEMHENDCTVTSPGRRGTASAFPGSELIRNRFSTRRAALLSTTFVKHKVLSFFDLNTVLSDESYTGMRGVNIQPGATARASSQ
jgi:hypothetical protein